MIEYQKEQKLIAIHTKNSSYLFTADSALKSLHWGGSVRPEDCAFLAEKMYYSPLDPDLSLELTEFPIGDGQQFAAPCLQARREARRANRFEFTGCRIEEEKDGVQQMELRLTEPGLNLTLRLCYEVYAEYDMIGRKAVLENCGRETVLVRRLFAGAVHPPRRGSYSLRYLSGAWAAENQITDTPLTNGLFTLESRLGTTGHRFNPAFALSQHADEEQGEVWFGLLGCTGSWKLEFEKTAFGAVSVLGGRNDFEGETALLPGSSLETPLLLCGYTQHGFGGMSRQLHSVERSHFAVTQKPRRVLFNSWASTHFDVNAQNQMALADKAAAIGTELFVVDDGWFGARNSDQAGLGDWYVNREKFPNGLEELIAYVNRLGMDFGLWVEPEAINPDSDLYRAHPDWIYRQDGIEPRVIRNQYLLNIALPPVKAFILEMLRDLLTRYPITFLKWDMNSCLTDLDCRFDQSAAHEQALYEIWDTLAREFPDVELENCSGGGGRCDLGLLSRSHQCWVSDNSDPFERLLIQEGFTNFYPPSQMSCWVTDLSKKTGRAGRAGLAYRFHASMCGALGIGADITKLSEDELAAFRSFIEQYKTLRPIIQQGLLYRLRSPRKNAIGALQYNSPDKSEAVVFAFLHSQAMEGLVQADDCRSPEEKLLRLADLCPKGIYQVEGGKAMRGDTLMHLGYPINLRNDFDSCLLHLKRIK